MNRNLHAPRGRASTLYMMHFLTHATRSALDEQLKPEGISSFHYTILRVISDNPGLSSAALSRRFYVTPQTMGEMLIMLESKGYLDRRPNVKNQRALALHLTELGQSKTVIGDRFVEEIEARIFANLDPAAIEAFRGTIAEALNALRKS